MQRQRPEPKHRWRLSAIAAAVVVLVAGCSPETESQPAPSGSAPTSTPSTAGQSTPTTAGRSTPTTAGRSTPTTAGRSTSLQQSPSGPTPIRITIGDTVLRGQLADNPTTRYLLSQLPLTLEFSDLNSVEKIGHLPTALSMDGMPRGDDPQPGDIGYHGGNLVLYYGDVGYWDGIARLGRLDGNLEALSNQSDDFTARVELSQ